MWDFMFKTLDKKKYFKIIVLIIIGFVFSISIVQINPNKGYLSEVEVYSGYYDVNNIPRGDYRNLFKLGFLNLEVLRYFLEQKYPHYSHKQISILMSDVEINKGKEHDSYIIKKFGKEKKINEEHLNLITSVVVDESKISGQKIYILNQIKSVVFPYFISELLFIFIMSPIFAILYLVLRFDTNQSQVNKN